MTQKEVHEKAIRLVEGGVVEIDGNWFSLIKFPDYYDDIPCNECQLDSICRMNHVDICSECECITKKRCCLKLGRTRRVLKT